VHREEIYQRIQREKQDGIVHEKADQGSNDVEQDESDH